MLATMIIISSAYIIFFDPMLIFLSLLSRVITPVCTIPSHVSLFAVISSLFNIHRYGHPVCAFIHAAYGTLLQSAQPPPTPQQ